MNKRTAATVTVAKLNHPVAVLGLIRIFSSFAWLNSAFIGKDAKFAISFLRGNGLVERINSTFVHTALTPGIAHLLTSFVEPHAAFFATTIAVADAAIGTSLLFGLFARLGGAVAILRAATNIAVAGGAGADTIGFNFMLIVVGAAVIVSAAGRVFGVDGILIGRFPNSRLLQLLS